MTGSPVGSAAPERTSCHPRVSVCVATYRRPAQLKRLLDHLVAMDPPAGGFEVVVVDDGSPPGDGVAEVLASAASRFSAPLRWFSLPSNSGRAAARNAAWRGAQGEWVAFTDDDCRPDPKWLCSLLNVAEASGRESSPAVVQGRVVPDPARSSLLTNPLARSLRVDSFNDFYQTANILYRRAVLEQVGGFDEQFPGAGEDTELGWRVRESGFSAEFAPDAVVVHDVVLRTFRDDLRDRARWGDVVQVIKLHPGTRRLAWRRFVYRKSHVGPLIALAGMPLVLGGRRPRRVYAAAVLVGLVYRLRGARSPSALLQGGQVLLGDCFEVGVLLGSSIRQRTVLL